MLYFSEAQFQINAANEHRARQQWAEVESRRIYANNLEKHYALQQGFDVNAAARIPAEVYREFDRQVTDVWRDDEGETLLTDLEALSRSVDIGKIKYEFAKASDSGNARTTLTGQATQIMDKADYGYDSTIIPIHQDGFGRQWRETEGQRSEDFDALLDDQKNAVRSVRRQMVSWILDGSSTLTFDNSSWTGIRNDTTRVQTVDLGAGGLNIDLTSASASSSDIRNAFKTMTNLLRITNKVSTDITYHVSREVFTNLDRPYNDAEQGWGTLLGMVKNIVGVADVKETAAYSGNELSGMPLSDRYVRPLVGMAVNTVAIPRNTPFENHNFLVWSAMGFQAVTDTASRKGILYANG